VSHYVTKEEAKKFGGSMFKDKSILITGGAGTLGQAIIRRSIRDNWNSRITIFSTDPVKHTGLKKMYPGVHSIIGDIRDSITVYNALAGKDIVIHAAAVKEIPTGEWNSIDTHAINVEGSLNVANAAIQHGIPHIVGISTDKVCHAANAYGATKYLMEKHFQEFSRIGTSTSFHLVRYGNVLESSASVLQVWKNAFANGEPIKITNPEMTRFWLSPSNAVDLIESCIRLESGNILIPKMKSLSILKLAQYIIGGSLEGMMENIPLRPGEKMHETLLTRDETDFAIETDEHFILAPSTSTRNDNEKAVLPYSSDTAPRLSQEELMGLLQDE
jgi:UDP-N-acetylglucosamine 4,6-dehydratase